MRFSFNKYLTIIATLLCFSNISFASSVISCATGSYDYGDAKGYGQACHDTNNWQQLGKAKVKIDNPDYDSNIPKGPGNKEFLKQAVALQGASGSTDIASKNSGWNAETSQNEVDKGDNGVSWRIVDELGIPLTKFGTNEEFQQGQHVEFKFIVTRSDEGNHEFDQLKAWNDWNGNGTFDESEVIVDEKWYKVADTFEAGNTVQSQDGNGSWNNDPLVNGGNHNSIKNSDVTQAVIKVLVDIPLNAVIGDTWMRARIICENSLTHDARDANIFEATGYYHQGEVEDYKVTINQVPEPTTLLVFGSALFGLLLNRKKST